MSGVPVAAQEPGHARDDIVSVDNAEGARFEDGIACLAKHRVAHARLPKSIKPGHADAAADLEAQRKEHGQRAAQGMTRHPNPPRFIRGDGMVQGLGHRFQRDIEPAMDPACGPAQWHFVAIQVRQPVAQIRRPAKGDDDIRVGLGDERPCLRGATFNHGRVRLRRTLTIGG